MGWYANTFLALVSQKSFYSLSWEIPPRNIFVVKKPWSGSVRSAAVNFIKHLSVEYPQVNIIVEDDVAEELQGEKELNDAILYTGNDKLLYEKTDLLVTIGGDGTILHATSRFAAGDTPPVLSFSLGTLGFLLPFDLKDSATAFKDVYTSQSTVMNRIRLKCEIVGRQHGLIHAMNDLNIHRGPDPHLTMLDISVDGQFVTRGIADGVIVSTPTGSTAYSLSAGGSIVHPSVSCILITPICPRSLSFRPLVFPSSSKICIGMSPQSRGQATELSIDGISRGMLHPGDTVTVESEKGVNKGIWCVARTNGDWVRHVNELLGFNLSFGQKASSSH